jgi:pimeloyl-ACP methyl ester carboxylesterase
MAQLAYERHGAGAPLVLLHGIGSSRHVWEPILPALAEHVEVLAVDLPGFGGSDPLPADVEPLPAAIAASVAGLLRDLGITAPHVVGNSLGGWVGLELARVQALSSLTLLSPAGLWSARTPFYTRASLRSARWLSRHAEGLLSVLTRTRIGRALVLGQTHGRPTRLTPAQARRTIDALARAPGFEATLAATVDRHYQAEPGPYGVPVTVAFGSRDLVLLPWQSRHVEQLPCGTRIAPLPGCGHVPVFDDPEAVTTLITESIAWAGAQPSPVRRARSGCPTLPTPTLP